MTTSPKKPNILFLMADQLSPSFLPAYGNGIAKTPHLNALASGGTVFERAYSNNPLCAPARFSLMSGKLTSEIGAYDNGAEFPASVPTISHYLRAQGYRTAISGKMHYVGPDQLHGSAERLTPEIYPAGFAWSASWRSGELADGADPRLFTDIGIARRTVQHDHDEEVTYRAVGKLYDWARDGDNGERPFFLIASLTHPHDPYVADPASWDRYDPAEIDLPKIRYGEVESDPLSERARKLFGIDLVDWDDARLRTIRHAYYANISYVDDKVGQILAALEDCGYADNTIVVFTSDHGDMMGERGLFQKRTFFEGSVRVPLIVSAPTHHEGGLREASPVSLIDLLPTFLEAAGGGPDDYAEPLEGASLIPCLEGAGLDRAGPIFAEVLSECALAPLLMVRQGRWKCIWSMVDAPLLFDLDADPHEQANLARDPNHQETLTSFEKAVHDRWDVERLNSEVILNQQRRRLIIEALGNDAPDDWDDPPPPSGKPGFLRGGQTYGDWVAQGLLRS